MELRHDYDKEVYRLVSDAEKDIIEAFKERGIEELELKPLSFIYDTVYCPNYANDYYEELTIGKVRVIDGVMEVMTVEHPEWGWDLLMSITDMRVIFDLLEVVEEVLDDYDKEHKTDSPA